MSCLVCTPLRSEQVALARRLSAPVVRTGRGPGGRVPGAPAVPTLVAGLAGALTDDLATGDVVVADEVRGQDVHACHAAPLLVGALRRRGLRVRSGTVLTRPHVVDGTDRIALRGCGALAVDTESAYLAGDVPDGRLAVLRVVVDTPSRPLARPGTVWRGTRALQVLGQTAPVVDAWAAATGDREVLLAAPRSFCAGVERAIQTVERALERFGAPVYVRHQIVHNIHVVRDLERRGAVFVEEVDEVPEGERVVLSAHGVAPQVREAAQARRLRVIDATCPLVTKVHSEVRRFADRGATVVLIGHGEHEEVVGTRGEAPGRVVVVSDPEEAAAVQVPDPGNVAFAMQTTLAVDEAVETESVLRQRFPSLAGPHKDDICYATTNRQQAVRAIARQSDLVLVLGSDNSSNSHRLVEVARTEGVEAHLVDDAESVELGWLAGTRRVGVTAGASAPPHLVDELLTCLSGLGRVETRETNVTDENVQFQLPKEVV